MSVIQPIRKQLEAAARDQCPQPWCAVTREGRLATQVAALGPVGLSFHYLTYTSAKLAGLSMPELQAACRQLAQRLSYLMEPIQVIEADENLGTVQMRSDPPSQEEDQISYFELLAHNGGELKLVRYRKSSGQSREAILSDVTFQVLERLATDFDAV
jgi:hypothetical protein